MSLGKTFQIFKISFQQEFVYRLNFIMWRVRNVFQILLTYFLWSTVFADPERIVFGYTKEKILTYVFGIILIRALVFSARSVDVPGEISDGSLTNYLLKPINYFTYWFSRDLSSKALNVAFSIVEFVTLAFFLKPTLFFQDNVLYLVAFIATLLTANYLIFIIRFIVTSVTFWVPELAWGGQFLFMVIITEFLSGAIFPLDIFPDFWQKFFYFTPFPYLIFFPLQVYLGKISSQLLISGISISLAWSILLTFALKVVWLRGLKVYSAEGR